MRPFPDILLTRCLALLLVLLPAVPAIPVDGATPAPVGDIHVHFNWDQKEIISADEIVARMERQNIAFTVVSATPSHLALELKAAGGERIIPFFSPYTHELGRRDWFLVPATVELARAGLASGAYRGIGEVHFMAGFTPRLDNRVFGELLVLARDYAVPMLVHVDSGSADLFLGLCREHADIRFIFAHAGGNLQPDHVRQIVAACDNVLVEFSARDPWRYGGLTGPGGELLPGWRELVLDYPDRFAIGTDPVWRVTRTQSWDQADDGWDYFDDLLAWHRHWIAALPVAVQEKVRLTNARTFVGAGNP